MFNRKNFVLLEDPKQLAQLNLWSEEVYRDLLAVECGTLPEKEFRERYLHRKAILVLDMTGFTAAALQTGEVAALLRILGVHKLCEPIFRRRGATLVHAFADDMVALFDDPGVALNTAFEIHATLEQVNAQLDGHRRVSACIGIGYGDVFAIGPNSAMGNEMNCASKLGEDTARARETLLTENAYVAVKDRAGVIFKSRSDDELPFPFFSADPARDG
jgi:adenylate cyclase